MRKGQLIMVVPGIYRRIDKIIDAEGNEVMPDDPMPPGTYRVEVGAIYGDESLDTEQPNS